MAVKTKEFLQNAARANAARRKFLLAREAVNSSTIDEVEKEKRLVLMIETAKKSRRAMNIARRQARKRRM